MPIARAPLMSDGILSPTIAVVAAVSPSRSRAIRKSGGSGLPTTTGWTPAATATDCTIEPQPGRKSPPSIGRRGSMFGVTSGAPRAAARAGVEDVAVPDAAVEVEDETPKGREARDGHER